MKGKKRKLFHFAVVAFSHLSHLCNSQHFAEGKNEKGKALHEFKIQFLCPSRVYSTL